MYWSGVWEKKRRKNLARQSNATTVNEIETVENLNVDVETQFANKF